MTEKKQGLLFLCVANSARSQMAEGLARSLAPDHVEVFSAGSEPGTLNPFAVKAMAKAGINIRAHYSKPVNDVPRDKIDTVVTLCAEEVCPVFLGKAKRLHWPFPDPAGVQGSDEEILASFERVRDGIKARLDAAFWADFS